MSVKRVPPPPHTASFLNEQGKVSLSWINFFDSLRNYANQQAETLTDLDTNISAPSDISDAAKLDDLQAAIEQINEIQSRLRTT